MNPGHEYNHSTNKLYMYTVNSFFTIQFNSITLDDLNITHTAEYNCYYI